MARVDYDIEKLGAAGFADYSGDPFDPLKLHVDAALGSYGAIPPYFIRPGEPLFTEANYDPQEVRESFASLATVHSQMPLKVRAMGESEWFTLPLEPLVTISGKNTIIRRNVAKSTAKGTIKERWSQDDYEVSILGVMTIADEAAYPEAYVKRLIDLFDQRQSIEVAQDILVLFGINYLAVEAASFPHTKGLNNQHFEIKGYSDHLVNLFIER